MSALMEISLVFVVDSSQIRAAASASTAVAFRQAG